MIFLDKSTSTVPAILASDGRKLTEKLRRRYNKGERNFTSDDFDSSVYGDTTVKTSLKLIQYGKCGFCESKIHHISYGDVEHFRPKAGWVQLNEKLNKPGYYWLAYNWNNLLLSCQLCNQRYKRNLFPLLNPSERANSHKDKITKEQSVFINPFIDNPELFIEFNEEIPKAVGANKRGAETINKLSLDREELNEQRRTTLSLVRDLYGLAKGCPDTTQAFKSQAKATIIKYFNLSKQDSTEYASMLRSFFAQNPIDF